MAPVALIPDASVVVKWFAPEPDRAAAVRLRDLYLAGELDLVIPDLLYYEVANALRFSRLVPPGDAADSLADLFAMELLEEPLTERLAVDAWRVAHEAGITFYDAAYLAVARKRNGVVVTADREFVRKARSRRVASLADAVAALD